MNLAISLLVIAALGEVAFAQPDAKSFGVKRSGVPASEAKGSAAKTSKTKQKETSQTSKRELFEGNFGDRKEKIGLTPDIDPEFEYDDDLKNLPQNQSPAHELFGVRLPHIAKISDVLTGQGPSFEAAVANQLYSPVSVYQSRVSLPTSFEIPIPAASQRAIPRESKAYQQRKHVKPDQKLQIEEEAEVPQAPIFAVKHSNIRFETYPQSSAAGLPHKIQNRNNIFYQPAPFSKQPVSRLFPLYDQLGPIRYPGHVLPSQYLQQHRIYQIVPVNLGIDYAQIVNNGEKEYSNQESQGEFKEESTGRPTVLADIRVPKHGYHAHPNGAISFARFSPSAPFNAHPETILQLQPDITQVNFQQQPEANNLQLQYQPLSPNHLQKQNLYTPIYQKNIQNYQSEDNQTKPRYIYIQPVPSQSKTLNHLQQYLPFQDSPLPTPEYKPLPEAQLTAGSFFQPTRTSLVTQETLPHHKPVPYEYRELPAQHSSNIEQPFSPAPQKPLTPLPPLNPNYNHIVQPLSKHKQNIAVLPLNPLHTSTPNSQPAPDQLISSTTVHPDVKQYDKIYTESEPQPETTQKLQQLEPEIIHQSQPTLLPISIQSTSHQQPQQLQQSTPQPQYQQIIESQSPKSAPRHTVVIQKQEIKELFFEPIPLPSSTPKYQPQHLENLQSQQEKNLQLQIQQHQQLQEKSRQYQKDLLELNALQYRDGNRQIQALREQIAAQQTKIEQYQKQHHSEPNMYQFQSQESQKSKPEQTQNQQPVSSQIDLQQYQQHQPHQEKTVQIEQKPIPQNQQVVTQTETQPYTQQQPQEHVTTEPQQYQHQQPLENQNQIHSQAEAQQLQTQQEVTTQTEPQQYLEGQNQIHSQSDPQQLQIQQEVLAQTEPQQSQQQQYLESQNQIHSQTETQQLQIQPEVITISGPHQQHLEGQNQIQVSTPYPSQEPEKQLELVEFQHQPALQQQPLQAGFQSTTAGAHDLEGLVASSEPTDSLGEPYLKPLLHSSVFPQVYSHPVGASEAQFGSTVDLSAGPKVQYFGKYAEAIFGGLHH